MLALAASVLALVPQPLLREAGWRVDGRLQALGVGLLMAAEGATYLAAPGLEPVRLGFALVVGAALALVVIDVRLLLIPNLYTAVFAVAGLVGPLARPFIEALLGGLLGGGMLLTVRAAASRRLGEEAMGWGDVKLAAALGILLGPLGLLWTVSVGAGAGAIVGLFMRRRAEAPRIPFGAFLAVSGVAVLWVERAG